MPVKSGPEIEEKIAELCQMDATEPPAGMTLYGFLGAKIGAVKALLWALGINDDDRFHVTAAPGPPIVVKPSGRVQ